MAVYTDLTDDELAALLGDYDLGPALAFKGIAEGVENSNFMLETPAGRFILTIFEKRVSPADLPFFMGVMGALADAGLPAPGPVRRRDGEVLSVARGKSCVIITFLQGVSPRRPNVAQCRALGSALAQMHGALAGLPLTRANSLGPTAWAPLIRPHLPSADELRPGLAAAIEDDLAFVDAWIADEARLGLPRGVIHADLFPDNVLLLGDDVAGLIDFYFACTDALVYDLAICLNAWCFETDRGFNITKARAMVQGYEKERPLTPAERAALPGLARGAALRFFATRLHDWFSTPPGALVKRKDPLEYADKLEFHRRALGPADYGA
ncbi:MAG: homoserine kinase [Caulobacterales bacterium]